MKRLRYGYAKGTMRFNLMVCAFALCAASVGAEVRVVDGDTLEVSGETMRINGIDAPEAGQKCATKRGSEWACGREAVAAMAALVEGKEVSCDKRELYRYGRWIATCFAGGVDVGEALVVSGHAWAFLRFSDVYESQQSIAQAAELGIWQAPTQTPWEFREERWGRASAEIPDEAPEGCPIKGNISDNGRIYHAPWSPWYNRTKINTAKGERWFCDEGEAVAAGWRAPKWW